MAKPPLYIFTGTTASPAMRSKLEPNEITVYATDMQSAQAEVQRITGIVNVRFFIRTIKPKETP